jgi:hypothetical protein
MFNIGPRVRMSAASLVIFLALLLLGYKEVCLRVGQLANRILLFSSSPANSLLIIQLGQLAVCTAAIFSHLVTKELRAAAFYLLVVKAILVRRPAVWWPDGLANAFSLTAVGWLALGHLILNDLSVEPAGGLLVKIEAVLDLITVRDRLALWLAMAAALYLLGCLALIGWLIWRAILSLVNRWPIAGLVLCCTGLALICAVGLGADLKAHPTVNVAVLPNKTTALLLINKEIIMSTSLKLSFDVDAATGQAYVCETSFFPTRSHKKLLPDPHFNITLLPTTTNTVRFSGAQCRISPQRGCQMQAIKRHAISSAYSFFVTIYNYIMSFRPYNIWGLWNKLRSICFSY